MQWHLLKQTPIGKTRDKYCLVFFMHRNEIDPLAYACFLKNFYDVLGDTSTHPSSGTFYSVNCNFYNLSRC